MVSLRDQVVLITGASRGAGRGIALALGEAGCRVYVTARSVRGDATDKVGGTIEQTAEDVSARGGQGIAVRCDHTDDAAVRALFERIVHESGRLDVLVNNVWGGYEQQLSIDPFWEQPIERLAPQWERMFTAGLRAHLVASRFAIDVMLRQGSGLIINTTAWDEGKYLGNLVYDVAKAAVQRMSFGLAHEVRKHTGSKVAVVALAPGWMRTERVLAVAAEQPELDLDLQQTESPQYVGRAVAVLAADPDVSRWSGQVLTSGGVAETYGFTDVDGRRLPPFKIPEV